MWVGEGSVQGFIFNFFFQGVTRVWYMLNTGLKYLY